jgi:predicted glycoside hydrolase/deacetylase ChbG (UPF0249 family)
MRKLIVNADDLGLTPGVNAGIARGLTAGIVSDTTLMVNTDHTAAAVLLLKEHGIRAAGLHLNLTYGAPVLPAAGVPSLVDASGRFRRPAEAAAAALRPDEAARELAAQVEKFQTLGLELTHLDSHHHVHAHPVLIDIAIDLARRLAVPMRQTSPDNRRRITAAGLACPDSFTTAFYGPGVSRENLTAILAGHTDGILEIMCHPAVADDLLPRISSYSSERQRELAILTDPAVKALLAEAGIELVSYTALKQAGGKEAGGAK